MSLRRRILLSSEFNGQHLSPRPPLSPSRQLPSHVIIAAASVAAASVFLAIVYYAVLRHRRRRPPFARGLASDHDTSAASSDSDHPIWHVKTVGLDDSAIDSIGCYLHRGGDTTADCSVCLGQLAEGETVRWLPRCSHAFHVQCIDTWLRSHVSCPLCRTAVVVAPPSAAAGAEVEGDPAADDPQLEQEEEADARASVEDSPEGLESSETVAGASRSISMDTAAIGGILFRVDDEKEGNCSNCSKEEGSEKGQSESGRGFLFSRLGRARSSSLLPL